MAHTEFDYIIVGAGSAGCVLANRLSEDPDVRVALIEAGGRDKSLIVHMPAGAGNLIRDKGPFNWGFETAPQQHLDGRRLFQPRGKGWGGSSSINGMIYVRGHARDYDHWRQLGLTGWAYRDVLPYFKRSEHNEMGADAWRGQGGPLHVSRAPSGNPIYKAFIQAGVEAGYPLTRDFNGYQQEGVGLYHLTIKDGARWSAAAAYLTPILDARPNLTIISNARTTRVLIERGRAVGVEYAQSRSGARHSVRAAREVLLAAGALQSPHILLLSGIGPAEEMKRHGIAVACDAPEVGRNLQDHLDISLIWEMSKPLSVYSMTKGLKQMMVGLDYMRTKQGPGRTNHLHAGAFLRTRPELDAPDIQLHLVNAVMIDHGKVRPDRDGFTVHVCQLRPESRGHIGLNSPDPFADPLIDPNYLATDNDRRTLRDSVKMTREIIGQGALSAYRGREMRPGAEIQSEADIDAWIRRVGETIYHPVGTCRMGVDAKSVVDPELKVRGVEGLRVIDASVMPTLIGGNTNAPTIMIAEKASDMIRGRAPPPPQDAPIAEDARAAAV